MNRNKVLEKIVIIDFGSQFTQLIARKVREVGVFSEIINFNQVRNLKKNKSIKGIILSGGPLTTTDKNSINLDDHILRFKFTYSWYLLWSPNLSKKIWRKSKNF